MNGAITPANTTYPMVPLGKVLKRVERFESRSELEDYQFAGTYSFARGVFVGELKSGSSFRLDKIQRIYAGDFVYCKIMAWEGAFGVVPEEANNCVLSGAFVVYEIDQDQVEPLYLDYYFKLKSVWQSVGSSSTGTNIRRRSLHPEQFETATIPLPPIAEQRRIVARVEELAGKVAEARGLRSKALEEAAIAARTIPSYLMDSVQSEFPTCPIGRLINFRNDLIRPIDGKSGALRFIGLQHIESHTGKRIGEDRLLAEELTGRKFKFSPGEVVYGYLRPYLNKVWIADCDGVCSVDQYVIQPNSDLIDTAYLVHFMRSQTFLNQAIELTHNLMLPRLRTALLESITIPLPPLPEQRRIVTYLDNLQAKIDALKRLQAETEAELNALLPSILDKAFQGEL